MGKIKEILIDKFDGGMATDPRSKNYRQFYHTKHFDAFSFPHKIVPRFTTTDKITGIDAMEPLRFIYDADNAGTYRLWALTRQTSTGKAALFKFLVDTDEWGIPTGNLFDTTSVMEDAFLNYKGYAYLYDGSRYLMRYKLDQSGGSEETYQDLTSITKAAQHLHCLKDDILYLFHDNIVSKLNNASWTATALTLPSTGYIVGACEYGDYIAIAFRYTNEIKSSIFLWNRDDSLTTTSQRWDLPSSAIYHIAVLNGRLMVIDTDFIKIYVRRFNGAEFEKINELQGVRKSFLEDQMTRFNVIADDKLLFPMDYDAPGYATDLNTRLGIWAVDSSGRITLDTAVEGATFYRGLFYLQGNLWISYDNKVAKTGITYSITNPSVYETLFIGEANLNKKLIKAGVRTEALPTDGKVVLKYRTVEEGEWTTIFTNTTDNSYYHEAINIEATGADLPEFREMQFRVESTGGAVITGLTVKYEELDDNLA